MKKILKKNKIFIIILLFLVMLILFMVVLHKSKIKFYSINLEMEEGLNFVGSGIIVDSNSKDSFNFMVESINIEDKELNTCSINYYNQIRIYIGNNKDRIMLDSNLINFNTVYIIDDNNHNNIINDLLNNKDNIYFCFAPEYESPKTDEICLKAIIKEYV